jgi:DNA-directed RNA polymerase specialized sigma24 family protein
MRAAIRQNRQREFRESIVDERQAIESFLQNRDEESFCALFKAVYGRVLRYFLLRGTDEMAAEELTQNVLFAVYRRAGEFPDHQSFRGWLFTIARNELLQHWRRNRARIQTAAAAESPARSLTRLTRENWEPFLQSLLAIARALCGRTGARLILESGRL